MTIVPTGQPEATNSGTVNEVTAPLAVSSTWNRLPALQQPAWPERDSLEAVLRELSAMAPLVGPAEVRDLRTRLAEVAAGGAFLLQAGDCAESFDDGPDSTIATVAVIGHMAEMLTRDIDAPVVRVGRMAGQYAKPRSSPVEHRDGMVLPSFFGHMVNHEAATPEARRPDPRRLLTAYHHSAATLRHLRSLAAEDPASGGFWVSHEALILDYEAALRRRAGRDGTVIAGSAHFLWVGERTRQPAGAHVRFLAEVDNPVGCKLGPDASAQEVVRLCEVLDPDRVPGRLTLVPRMGAVLVGEVLPPILRAVRDAGHPVAWVCDPMHANTVTVGSGRKTRRMDDILDELAGFITACRTEHVHPGGVHLELTGTDVTECLGGPGPLVANDLNRRYLTLCDPRLNGPQGLHLAAHLATMLTPDAAGRT